MAIQLFIMGVGWPEIECFFEIIFLKVAVTGCKSSLISKYLLCFIYFADTAFYFVRQNKNLDPSIFILLFLRCCIHQPECRFSYWKSISIWQPKSWLLHILQWPLWSIWCIHLWYWFVGNERIPEHRSGRQRSTTCRDAVRLDSSSASNSGCSRYNSELSVIGWQHGSELHHKLFAIFSLLCGTEERRQAKSWLHADWNCETLHASYLWT